MPSDRAPSQAEIEAAAREAFWTDDLGGHIKGRWTWETIPEMGRESYRKMVRAALSAAATARPDRKEMPEEMWRWAEGVVREKLEAECGKWEGIARELYEALAMIDPDTLHPVDLRKLRQAKAAYERASLGEGSGEESQ